MVQPTVQADLGFDSMPHTDDFGSYVRMKHKFLSPSESLESLERKPKRLISYDHLVNTLFQNLEYLRNGASLSVFYQIDFGVSGRIWQVDFYFLILPLGH